MTIPVKEIKSAKPFYSNGRGATELLVGPAVINLLEDSGFVDGWNYLFSACPWATVFQSPSFVTTWYRVYGTVFLPILIKTEYAGRLTGLLTLAKDKNGLITGAGTNQAEYQVWLAEDASDDTFIRSALFELHSFFPRNKILLKYIPAGVSLNFTKRDPKWNKRCFVKASPQPLMNINDDHLTNELKKKNRREKINRLKRLGALAFERISDYTAFASVFDELALQSDFRKGAMYNKVVFKADPLRKQFLLTLFEQNNLHATILKLDDKIIASNVSICGNSRLHLQGINSFAAPYARYSPGIIHFLLLGKLLANEEVAVFDLTPGADAYKETLATDYTEAYTLGIGNNYYGLINNIKFRLNRYVKNTAALFGIKRSTLKKLRRNMAQPKVKFLDLARQGFAKTRKKTMQCWVVQKTFSASGFLNIQKDDLNDLLNFDQRETMYSQQEFLADAMHRFEEGAHCYSWAEDGLLLGCAWLTNLQSTKAEYSYGHNTEGFIIQMSGLYCHQKGRKRFCHFLQSMANELAVDISQDRFCLVTDCREDLAFEKAGFRRINRPAPSKNSIK